MNTPMNLTDFRSHPTFEQELAQLINKHSLENGSNTPDYALARFLVVCMGQYNDMCIWRQQGWGDPTYFTNPNRAIKEDVCLTS